MSITDVIEADRHVGEILPSMEDNSAKVVEDQPQEEASIATEATRSLEVSEDYALHYLTRSVVKMMDNIGFSTCHESVLYILTDLCKRYMQKLWVDSKVFAEHAGRRYPIFEDANMAFGKLMFSAAELHAFMKQVEHDPFENDVPLFPVRKSSPNLLSIYGPVSDKELAERPEHIPRYFPAMHPEWCSDQIGVRAVEVSAVKSATQGSAKNNKCIPRGRVTKSKISFPDFSGSTAKELGFVRPQKLPSKKVVEEPSGISSSANIAALQIMGTGTSSPSKTKLKKCSMNESASSSKLDEYHVKAESPKDKDASDKSYTQRSIGMFGMPPSALVHTESAVSEKMKKKRKRDRDRDKDRTKEKKVKHREKLTDENEENPSTSSLVSVSTESLLYGKASTSSSCTTVARTDDQGNEKIDESARGRSFSIAETTKVLRTKIESYYHPLIFKMIRIDQIGRKVIDLKSITNEEPLIDVYFSHALSGSGGIAVCGKEDDIDKLKNDRPLNLRMNDGHDVSSVGSQMAEILKPQHSSQRAGDVKDDGVSDGNKAGEKINEGVKDGSQKNGKNDASKSTPVENVRGKLEKHKIGGKSNEWKKVAKKTTAESSLSVIVDSITKSSTNDDTPVSHLKTLKVVLSRPTGQKVFTALSPSSGTEQTVKDVEKTYDSGNMQGNASITPFTVDEPQIAKDICEKKKKHKKEKDRSKHHSKEHKRKDKRKYKEHKKSKTKDKEKKYIKLRPEKLCLKRSGEHILSDEMPTPKIPKLKIRFGSNSNGINASPSGIVSATSPIILTSALSSVQPSERDVPSLVDQNSQVMQPTNKVEDTAASSPYTSLRSDGNIKSRKRQPVTKAEAQDKNFRCLIICERQLTKIKYWEELNVTVKKAIFIGDEFSATTLIFEEWNRMNESSSAS
uniref:BTP domain-containing protein n=1 Tax=Onchocerca volvulus TaxID=6282 RepID=A0A8R1XYG1_ONCVO